MRSIPTSKLVDIRITQAGAWRPWQAWSFSSFLDDWIHAGLHLKYCFFWILEGGSIYYLTYGAHGSEDLPGFALLLTLAQYKPSSYAVIPSWCWSLLTAYKERRTIRLALRCQYGAEQLVLQIQKAQPRGSQAVYWDELRTWYVIRRLSFETRHRFNESSHVLLTEICDKEPIARWYLWGLTNLLQRLWN